MKILEEKIGIKHPEMDLGYDFLDMTPKAQAKKKKKSKQVGLHHTTNLLYRKRNDQQSEKTTYRMVKNICKPYI